MKRTLKRPPCAFSAVLSSMAMPPAAIAGVVLLGVEETGRDVDEVVAGVRGVTDDLVGASVKLADVLGSVIIFFTRIGRLLDDVKAIAGAESSPFSAALVDGASFLMRFGVTPENGCTSGIDRLSDSVAKGSFWGTRLIAQ